MKPHKIRKHATKFNNKLNNALNKYKFDQTILPIVFETLIEYKAQNRISSHDMNQILRQWIEAFKATMELMIKGEIGDNKKE